MGTREWVTIELISICDEKIAINLVHRFIYEKIIIKW